MMIKLQVGCIILILLIMVSYIMDKIKLKMLMKPRVFDFLLLADLICIVFDIATVYSVNHLETVPALVNKILHMFYLMSIDIAIFVFFYYILAITDWINEQDRLHKFMVWIPLIINCVVLLLNINALEYRVGEQSNYSMGVSVYTCYTCVAVYVLLTVLIFFRRWHYMESDKRRTLGTTMGTLVAILIYQMAVPDSLVASLGFTAILVMVYANMENPAKNRLAQYHNELMQSFADIIESRDGSTGGHVKRTTAYVNLLAVELRKHGYYKNILTKDYIKNLTRAAALHDIGKIATPDAILQKPGRLTDEEYQIMKQHSTEGGRLIRESLSKLGDEDYINMAYDVAMYHHERWDGKGYPAGLSGTQIPLAARIMAVADVFDAVAEKRCYREAMTLDQSFQILKDGMGTQFQTEIVECFLEVREKVEKIRDQFNG